MSRMPLRSRARLAVEPCEPRLLPSGGFADAPVIPVIDPAMKQSLRSVFQQGQAAGMNEFVFAKAGDSITWLPPNLTPLGDPSYDPTNPAVAGAYTGLADTVDAFRATPVDPTSNSFTRTSTASYPGWLAANVAAALPAEIGAVRPSVALVMVGTNDATFATDPAAYRATLVGIADEALARGVIPVLSTLPDNLAAGGVVEPRVLQLNQVVADVAADLGVPLWNYWRALQTLPNRGLDSGGVHPSVSPLGGGYFAGDGLAYGYNVRNLTAVQVLDKIRRVVFDDGAADPTLTGDPVTAWEPLQAFAPVLVVGADAGDYPYVSVFDATSGGLLSRFLAFDPGFTGGVRVATADVNGDGYTDVIAAAGPGGGPAVKVFSGKDGSVLAAFFAYETDFPGGVFVAAGDVTGDGVPDIVTGAGAGGGPHVEVFDVRTGQLLTSFFAYPASFRGGVSVAAGDVLGQGRAQIVTGAGPGGGPHVEVFDGRDGSLLQSFFAYQASFRGGVSVAAGDENGAGPAEIVTGAGAGGGPAVEVIDARTAAVQDAFFAFDPSFLGGVRVGVAGEGGLLGQPRVVLAAPGPGGSPSVRRLQPATGLAVAGDVSALSPTFLGGLFVAGS
jgi:lysophospholipase L1-like esterase